MSKAAVVESNEPSTGMQRMTDGPQRLIEFFKDTRQEMRKVITPSREEVQTGTIVVVATVFIFAAYFALIDAVLGRGVDKLFLKATGH